MFEPCWKFLSYLSWQIIDINWSVHCFIFGHSIWNSNRDVWTYTWCIYIHKQICTCFVSSLWQISMFDVPDLLWRYLLSQLARRETRMDRRVLQGGRKGGIEKIKPFPSQKFFIFFFPSQTKLPNMHLRCPQILKTLKCKHSRFFVL